MVTEIALIDVTPGREDAFMDDVRRNLATIASAPGAASAELLRCVEQPSRFVLQVEWQDISDHDAFRATDAFASWRADVGPHLANAPEAAHYLPVSEP